MNPTSVDNETKLEDDTKLNNRDNLGGLEPKEPEPKEQGTKPEEPKDSEPKEPEDSLVNDTPGGDIEEQDIQVSFDDSVVKPQVVDTLITNKPEQDISTSVVKTSDSALVIDATVQALPDLDIYPSLPEENTENEVLDLVEPLDMVEPSAPLPTLETNNATTTAIRESQESQSQDTTCLEPSAPPPSFEIDTVTNDNNTLHPLEIIRPRSQVISSHKPATNTLLETQAANVVSSQQMIPFTEEQLNHFYYNQELLQVDFFVDEFLKVLTMVWLEETLFRSIIY